MAFLDNSGDIILDAVLTDTGRYRLAKGDGSFKIEKFALGDDEIDYSLYNKNHPSGSAYYDLDILQTPVLEALTDNSSALKSKLISISRTDLLFLPVMKLFTAESTSVEENPGGPTFDQKNYFIVCADLKTESYFTGSSTGSPARGVFFSQTRVATGGNKVVVHQGLDTTQITPSRTLEPELIETVYMAEFDNRLGNLFGGGTGNQLDVSYIDDDQIATYLISRQTNGGRNVLTIPATLINGQPSNESSIRGPRGTSLNLSIAANLELATSTYLFEQLGSVLENFQTPSSATPDLYYIDTNLRITGATTGYRIDIPIRFVKWKND